MENDDVIEEKSFFDKILAKKALVFIFIGVIIRIFMLFFYYYTHLSNPQRSWGDLGLNYYNNWEGYTLLTRNFINVFVFLSFGRIEIFAFWAFFWDLLTCLMFYFVLKSFKIKNKNYAFSLFLLNPFFFLNNSFSLENCGYHITDAFFFFFLFLALIFYPRKEIYARYLFYTFLGLSMCAKYYTIPVIGFLLIKLLFEKDWKELKIFFIIVIPLLIVFIILPFLYFPENSKMLMEWNSRGSFVPIYIRIIPFLCIFILFILFRLKKSDVFEIIIISMVALGTYLFFSWFFLRWFQCIIFYGILKEREFFSFNLNLKFFKRKITIDNHLLTFYLSFPVVIISFLIIIFVFKNPIY